MTLTIYKSWPKYVPAVAVIRKRLVLFIFTRCFVMQEITSVPKTTKLRGRPKSFVLSGIWRYMCGWSNYSGIVISQWMMETEMGYRGSKSNVFTWISSVFVKEQRVDGSWCIEPGPKNKKLMHLRCTLMGFERSYQIRILSKVLHKKEIRFYSTSSGLEPQTFIFNRIYRWWRLF